ncbi:MAG: hypothetical protein ABIQ27_06730 [Flavobacterium sp.]|uniref:hypothetical protein n=1 Tax=Flavobacterium sp. TaxID=239 RepID=UPI0032667994
MNDKLTYRDLIVYTFNGLIGLVLISLVFREDLKRFLFAEDIHNEGLLLFLSIPICYIIGHVILSIDNLIFMNLFSKKFRQKLSKSKKFKWIHILIFGDRIVGVRDIKWAKTDGDFNEICVKIRNAGKIEHADRYYVLSDSFKGLVIIELIIILLTIYKLDWYYLVISIFLLLIFYLRAKKYSNEYVNEIKRQKKELNL